MAQMVTVRSGGSQRQNPNYRFVGGDYDFVTKMGSDEEAQVYAESLGKSIRAYNYGRFVPLEYGVDKETLVSRNPSLRIPNWVLWAENKGRVKLTKSHTSHNAWFKSLKWPRSGVEFDRISRGAVVFDKKNKVVKLLTWGASEGRQASNEVVKSVARNYSRTMGWDLEEYDYADAWGAIKNPFGEALVEGMGSGAGMAISAGLLAPLVVDRAAKVFNKLGLIKKNPDDDAFVYSMAQSISSRKVHPAKVHAWIRSAQKQINVAEAKFGLDPDRVTQKAKHNIRLWKRSLELAKRFKR